MINLDYLTLLLIVRQWCPMSSHWCLGSLSSVQTCLSIDWTRCCSIALQSVIRSDCPMCWLRCSTVVRFTYQTSLFDWGSSRTFIWWSPQRVYLDPHWSVVSQRLGAINPGFGECLFSRSSGLSLRCCSITFWDCYSMISLLLLEYHYRCGIFESELIYSTGSWVVSF